MNSNPRGYVLLINNVDFHDHEEPHRAGSDKDAKDLETVFSSLGFKVVPKRNLTGAVSCIVSLSSYHTTGDDPDVIIKISFVEYVCNNPWFCSK